MFCGNERTDDFYAKKSKTDQKVYPKQPKWSQKKAKVSQGTFKKTLAEQVRKRKRTIYCGAILWGTIFNQNPSTIHTKIHPKNDHPETLSFILTGCQNGTKIKTHKTSMPK